MSTLGDRIKIVRGTKTQKEFALLINVSRDVLANWETGRARPSADDIIKIVDIAGVTTDYLLGRVDNPTEKLATPTDISGETVSTFALSRADNPDADLPDEAQKQIEDFRAYIRQKYKKPE